MQPFNPGYQECALLLLSCLVVRFQEASIHQVSKNIVGTVLSRARCAQRVRMILIQMRNVPQKGSQYVAR